MPFSSRIFLYFLLFLFSIGASSLFAQTTTTPNQSTSTTPTCSLSDTSNSPMQKWRENINTLNTALRREADKTKCDTTTSGSVNPAFVNYIGTVVPLNSSVSLMKEIYGLSSSGTDFFSEVDNFLDPAGPVMELKSHTDFIEDVERSIIETAQYV